MENGKFSGSILHFRFYILNSSDLVSPFQHFITQDGILLKASRLALSGGRTLDVPIAEAEFADRTQVTAPWQEFSVEQSAD